METNSKESNGAELSQKDKRKAKRLPKSVRIEEFKEVVKIIPEKDKFSKISFLLAYGSGLRISEVLRCKKEDFK